MKVQVKRLPLFSILAAAAAAALAACGGGDPAPHPDPVAAPPPAAAPAPAPPAPAPPAPPAPAPPPIAAAPVDAVKAKLRSHLNDEGATAMASPPAIRAADGAGGIAGARRVGAQEPAFTILGRPFVRGAGDPAVATIENAAVGGGSNSYYIEFSTDAPRLEIAMVGNGRASAHRVIVDGRYAAFDSTVYPADGRRYLTTVDFGGGRTPRNIRIETAAMRFAGVNVGPGDFLGPRTTRDPVRVLVIGSSSTAGFTDAEGVGFPYDNYASHAARALGWSDLYLSGIGGTGFNASNGPGTRFRDRLETDVIPFAPEVLIVQGASNDTVEGIAAQAPLFFDDVARALPNTLVFVLGPTDPKGQAAPRADAVRRAVAGRANMFFIDNVGERWQTGTGTVAAPTGSGNGDIYVAADGVHFTAAGHRYFGERLTTAIEAIVRGF